MKPSITLLFPLLLTALFAHADGNTAAAPPAPAPTVTFVSPPPPTAQVVTLPSPLPPPAPEVTFASPPAPAVTMASSPPLPPAPAVTMASTPPPPAWTAVTHVHDKAVQKVGQFAVRIYALSTRLDVVFVRVVNGQTQPCDGGYKYQLVIAVSGTGAKAAQYDALVWGIYGTESWQLLSFTPAK